MRLAEWRKTVWPVLSVAVCGFCGGCATVPRRRVAFARETKECQVILGAEVSQARAKGWRAVSDAVTGLRGEPDALFPGIGALTDQIQLLSEDTSLDWGAPVFSARKEIDQNPDFWRAYYEAAPGQPSIGLLHVGLLLAAGETARAHEVATLWIYFGRMSLGHREQFAGLDFYARAIQALGWRNFGPGFWSRAGRLGEEARALHTVLQVWPQNSDALTYMVEAVWVAEGRPKRIAPGSVTASLAAKLRALDPMSPAFARVPAIGTPDLHRVQKLWFQVSDESNAGDLDLLRKFSVDAQAAHLDDLALCARSLLAGWEPAPKLPDEAFVHASLRRLVGATAADSICAEAYDYKKEWVGIASADQSPLLAYPGPFVHPQLEEQMLARIAASSYAIGTGRLSPAARVSDYFQRGQAWVCLGRLRSGIADLRHAHELDPHDDHIRWVLAAALGKSGDFKDADTLFARAARAAPAEPAAVLGWANDLLMEQRWKKAVTMYQRVIRLYPKSSFTWLMLGLARRREGHPAGIGPGAWQKDHRAWNIALVRYVSGRIGREAIENLMEPKGDRRRVEEECRLDFVEGELALSRGDQAAARRCFNDCVGTGLTNYIEYYMAKFELRRLKTIPSQPHRSRKGGAFEPGAEPV